MKTVRFLVDRTEQREGGRTFEKGSVHQLEDASARHWVVRGVAEYVEDSLPATVAIDITNLESDGQEALDTGLTQAEIDEQAAAELAEMAKEDRDGNALDSSANALGGKDSAGAGGRAEPAAKPVSGPGSGRGRGGSRRSGK